MGEWEPSVDVLRDALLDDMARSIAAVMVFRYHARESEETTEQARTLANAALVSLDDFKTERMCGFDGGGSITPHGRCESWPSTMYARLIGPWRVTRPGGRQDD